MHLAGRTLAQPPGTLPPSSITNRILQEDTGTKGEPGAGSAPVAPAGSGTPAGSAPSAVPIEPKAFLMLDSAGNPVMVPGMTFEKMDRLMRLAEGLERPDQAYALESLTIAGRVDESHAELNVTVRINVEPTGDAWIAIPLRMGNFHRTGPADVSGIESYRMDLAEDGNGYLLHLQAETRKTVVVAMRVVVRVSAPPTAAIEFRLPETVCDISLSMPDTGVSASIVGRGDEVVRTVNSGRSTTVEIESGGGTFSLRFGTQLPVIDNRPVLETDSQILVDWQQADNSPLAKVDMQIRNLRGDLPKVSLLVPNSMQLLQQPEVLNGSAFEVMDATESEASTKGATTGNGAAETLRRIDVIPTTVRGDSQVVISLDGQMRSEGGRAGGQVIMAPIAMDDAVEQKGEIEIRTPRDYRLRWTPSPWVHSIWEKADSDSMSSRVYRFRFDRVPFELPIWLSARARQLRLESDLRLTLYDSLASLRMTIKTSGAVPDSRILPIWVGNWKVQSVFIADTTTPIEADRNGDLLEIDLASLPNGGSEGDRIEMVLVEPLISSAEAIDLSLPHVAGNDDLIGTLPSSLTVVSQNDSRFVVDLSTSMGIGEVIRRGTTTTEAPNTSADPTAENRYSLPDIAQPCRIVGYLVRERPSVSVLADAEISIIADRIVEVVDWTIYPQGGLRGRLPIAWDDSLKPIAAPEAATVTPANTPSATDNPSTVAPPAVSKEIPSGIDSRQGALTLSPLSMWSVVVDDAPAIIRLDADGRYQVYSDRLGGGPHRIRFRRSRLLPTLPNAAAPLDGVFLPRPTLPDSTLRGPVVVRLRGSDEWSLTSMGSEGRFVDELTLSSIPQDDLPLQVKPVEKRDDDLIIRRGVLRTALGESTHHEQFIATIEGGGTLRIGLTKGTENIRVRATVDGAPMEVLRDSEDRCLIRLGDVGLHRIDLQVWVPRTSSSMIDTAQPLLALPIGIERLYWQIVVPQDQHLVWATPTMGRAMRWQLDRWRLNRVPELNDAALVAWSGVQTNNVMPPGNRYLLVGIDAGSLSAKTMSRQWMWLLVGATVLTAASVLIYVPTFRHPFTAVLGAIALGGLMLLLPDAAVIAGQLTLVAMLIVAVMSGVRHLLSSRRGDRVFGPSRESFEQPTTRQIQPVPEERIESYMPDTDPLIASGSGAESRS
jgi:hypothetical protein